MTRKPLVPAIDLSDLVTAKQAAEILHVRVRTLTEWRLRGKGPRYIRLGEKGSAVLYDKQSLLAFLMKRTVLPVGDVA